MKVDIEIGQLTILGEEAIATLVSKASPDESYFLKAVCSCVEGELVLEIGWTQIMYALTVELFPLEGDTELVYDRMIFSEDRVEIYGHKLMRITGK
ncbi:hypothetical protein [Gynuella sp.]|uniref:hypothetical protein n=1 Tax=Gynuella sp. TaxID=2969146 RepID=UPI003D0DCA7E